MFITIFCIFFLTMFAGTYWLSGRWLMLVGVPYNTKRSRIARSVLGVAVVVLCGIWRVVVIVVMHVIAFSLLCEIAAVIARRIGKRFKGKRVYSVCRVIYRSAAVPLLLTAALMLYGTVNMWHIVRTDYTVTSAKLADEYRIVLMTDTHFGSIQSPEVLEEKVDEINSLNADMIVLCGDITDESTTREQLDQVFEIYSRMKSRYGTFYTYGNHDRQEYAVANRRAYTPEEFADVVRSHGIKILQDDFVNIGNDLVLVGREDKSWKETPAFLPKCCSKTLTVRASSLFPTTNLLMLKSTPRRAPICNFRGTPMRDRYIRSGCLSNLSENSITANIIAAI